MLLHQPREEVARPCIMVLIRAQVHLGPQLTNYLFIVSQ